MEHSNTITVRLAGPCSPGFASLLYMMAAPRLIAFTDLSVASEAEHLARVELVSSQALPGTVLVVLRDKDRSARERLGLGGDLRTLTRLFGQLFGVAERLDLALLLEADAVHLGEHSVSGADARRLLGARVWVSRASHDPERAADPEVDAVVLSPVLQPRKGLPALGLAALARPQQNKPVYALGGVDAANAAECLAAGARGVAAIRAVWRDDPLLLLEALAITQPTDERNHS
jgi:thiamine-phosphate pyrophosphorylase